MNYRRLYEKIIENRKQTPVDGYTEKHHIIPRSLGGSDNKENLVDLTAKEHFLCHYLLTKMYKKESLNWYKMNHAFTFMKTNSYTQNRYFNSRLYEALKENRSIVMSSVQSGTGNSQYGTMWISNIELKESKKIKKTDPIPKGWITGRNKWNSKIRKNNNIRKRKYEQHVLLYRNFIKKQQKENIIKQTIILWDEFKNGNYYSLSEFCREQNICKMTTSNRFRKYIKEYASKSKRGTPFRS